MSSDNVINPHRNDNVHGEKTLLIQKDSNVVINKTRHQPTKQNVNNNSCDVQRCSSTSPSSSNNSFVWSLSCFAAIGGFLFGYDTGVTSGAMLLIKDKFSLNSVWQELVVTVAIGTAFLAALIGGTLNDKFGRRPVILIASFVFTAGAIVLGIAQNVAMLIVGRGLVGVGIGLASMTVPMYIAEGAPAHLRGRLVTVNNLFITGGQCFASFVDAGFSYMDNDGWRYMLGIGGIPSVIQFVGFLFLPESPRWLMSRGKKQEAVRILERIRGSRDVGQEVDDIQTSLEREQSTSDGGSTFLRMLRTPTVRRALVVGCGLQLFQQLIGINTVMYYSASIMNMSGVSDEHEAIFLAAAMATTNFLFTFVGIWLVDRVGRKKLTMGSLLGTGLSLVLSAIAFQLSATHSPSISQHPSFVGHNDSTCSTYRLCEPCIEDSDCGFCFKEINGSFIGSCLATDPDKSGHSTYGLCENTTLPSGQTWAYNYCPNPYWWMSILGMVVYLVFFAPGMGPMPWIINSEIYPLWARSTGNSLSAATNWLTNIVISMTFLTLTETITKYGTYWLYSGFAFLGLVFFAFYLPETKGQKLEDVEELFVRPWCSCCSSTPTSQSQSRDTQTSQSRATQTSPCNQMSQTDLTED